MDVFVENKKFTLKEGEVLIIPSGAMHGAVNSKNLNVDYYALVFDLDFITSKTPDTIQQKYLDSYLNPSAGQIFHIENHSPINSKVLASIYHLIENYRDKSYAYELVAKAQLLVLLSLVFQNKDSLSYHKIENCHLKSLDSYTAKRMAAFIEENFTNKITLEEASDYLGYTKEHFCRVFKKNFQMTFMEYLKQRRIRYAERHLLQTDKKIIEIAIECGFENMSHFSSVFKKFTGHTPSTYRKEKNH